MWYKRYIKRCFDIFFALFFLILFSPLLLIIALLILIFLGRPILFSQQRGGFYGSSFKLYKFRSMIEAKDDQGFLLTDAQRLTRFGSFLRKTSLDELPNLFNVLKGEMSLVGPRPLLVDYLPLYSQEEARRHHVLPGVTGWAQINGRNAISWEEKFKFDVWYVDHLSFSLDFIILCQTFLKVIRCSDINEEGEATVSVFDRKSKPQD